MIDDLTFLEEGKYTKQEENVLKLAEKVKTVATEKNIPLYESISGYITNKLKSEPHNPAISRKRTASQIIADGYVTGCTDTGLVFVTLARALGIPARYVETLQEKWLEKPDPNHVRGHIFADIFVDGAWRIYEPRGKIIPEYKMRDGNRMKVIGKGLDFSEMYSFEGSNFSKTPIHDVLSVKLKELFPEYKII